MRERERERRRRMDRQRGGEEEREKKKNRKRTPVLNVSIAIKEPSDVQQSVLFVFTIKEITGINRN